MSICKQHCSDHSLAQVSIFSKVKKHEPTYYLEVVTHLPNSTPSTREMKVPFTTWFTADGYFVAKPFQQWLASSVEVVGDADKKNASHDERDELASPTPQVFPIKSNEDVEVTGTDASGKGTQRKTKKKG
jgi:hypothetical protein